MLNPPSHVCHCELYGCDKAQHEEEGSRVVLGRVLSRKAFLKHSKDLTQHQKKQPPQKAANNQVQSDQLQVRNHESENVMFDNAAEK